MSSLGVHEIKEKINRNTQGEKRVFAQWKQQGDKWVEYVKICHVCVFSPAFETVIELKVRMKWILWSFI